MDSRRMVFRRARQLWAEHRWIAISLLAIVALVLGVVGAERGSFFDRLYIALQLFVLNGESAESPSPALQAARFLAPAVFLYATLRAIYLLFQERLQGVRARLRRNHVVICGLGRQGRALVRNFLPVSGVVVIERDPNSAGVQASREDGALVLIGDATNADVLRRARLRRASDLISVCGGDAINAEVAVRALDVARDRARPLSALVHLEDPRLFSLVSRRARAAPGVQLEFFNIFDRGARALLEEHDPFAEREPHQVLVVGLGRLGQAFIARSAQEWQRRYREGPAAPKLRVSVVDRNAHEKLRLLELRYSRLREIYEPSPLEIDASSPEFDLLLERDPGLADVAAAYVCFDDDARTVSAALSLAEQAWAQLRVVVARVADPNGGLALLLRDYDAPAEGRVQIRPVSLAEQTCRQNVVRQGTLDLIAREIHERGVIRGTVERWDALADEVKSRYVSNAGEVKRQLEAVGCRLGPLFDWGAQARELTADEIERMAEMEHERWRKERQEAGWREAFPRDDAEKLRPDLVAWDGLPESRRQIARDLVKDRPAMLASAGVGLYPG